MLKGKFQGDVSLNLNAVFQGDIVNQQMAKVEGAVAGDDLIVGQFAWVNSTNNQLVLDPLQLPGGFVIRNNDNAFPAVDSYNGASLGVARNTLCQYLMSGEIAVNFTNANATKNVTLGRTAFISILPAKIGQVFFNVDDANLADYIKLQYKVTRIYDNGLVSISNTYIRTEV